MATRVYVVAVEGKKNLQLRWQEGRRRRQKSAGTTRRREAERLADQLARQIDSGVDLSPLDWYDFCERHRVERLALLRKASRADWETASNHYGRLMAPETVRDVTANEISKFAAKLRAEGFTASRIAKFLGEIRRAMAWAAKLRLVEDVPFVAMPPSSRGGTMHARPVTAEEFERMLAVVPRAIEARPNTLGLDPVGSWRDTLTKYWLSGFRLEEAIHIYWDRSDKHCIEGIDRKRPKLRIRAALEKGNRDRLYPLTPDFVAYLRQTPAHERHGRVFTPLTSRGVTQSKITIGRTISAIGKAAGVVVARGKFASVHDFRRSFGTRWAPLVTPVVLQHLMRHSSINTTMRYYVDLAATSTADEVWAAFGTRLCDPLCDPEAILAIDEV